MSHLTKRFAPVVPAVLATLAFASAPFAIGCASTVQRARAAEKLPASGADHDVDPAELPVADLARNDWSTAEGARIAPVCDARLAAPVRDEQALASVGDVMTKWKKFRDDHPKAPQHGIDSSGGQDPTLKVESVMLTCAPGGGSKLVVNGKAFPFDVAWVLSGEGSSITDGISDAGHFALVQALSFAEQRMTVVKVFFPADANRTTDDTFVVASLDGFVPKGADPLVHNIGPADKPQLETLMLGEGGKSGFYYVATKQSDRTRARYVAVGRFRLGE